MIIIYGILGLYIYLNLAGIHDNYLNASEPSKAIEFSVFYPNWTGVVGQVPGGQMEVEFNLRADTPVIVDSGPVLLTVAGSIYPPLNASIRNVKAFFEGAVPYVPQTNTLIISPPAFGGVSLSPTKSCPIQPRVQVGDTLLCGTPQSIDWPLQGTYFSSLAVTFNNGTTVIKQYQDHPITVYSADVTQTRQYNRITIALTVALVMFGFVEGIKTFLQFGKRKRGS